MDQNPIITSPDVAAALAAGKPVVALESTVIAHGLPRPQNIETAARLEQIVHAEGATPATIAVINGRFCVGLDRAQLDQIATGQDIKKLSVRDLAIARARKWDGATTVASTIWVAHRAGIQVFATGGIGGTTAIRAAPNSGTRAELLSISRDCSACRFYAGSVSP